MQTPITQVNGVSPITEVHVVAKNTLLQKYQRNHKVLRFLCALPTRARSRGIAQRNNAIRCPYWRVAAYLTSLNSGGHLPCLSFRSYSILVRANIGG